MIDNLKLEIDAFLPLRDVVFDTLREAILKGDLQPGERLMEIQLANQLGVSRTPIREAIRMLEQEGLAITIPRRGALVAGMSQKDMEDVLEIREALEELAVKIACDKITDEQIEELLAAKTEFEKQLGGGDLKKLTQADIAFHDVIYKATDNQRLILMLGNIREQMYRYRLEYLKNKAHHDEVIAEHENICEALSNRDKGGVTANVKKHISNQVDAIRHIIGSS